MSRMIPIATASGRWCPFARTITSKWLYPSGRSEEHFFVANRDSNGLAVPIGTTCITTACMAWIEDPSEITKGCCGMVP